MAVFLFICKWWRVYISEPAYFLLCSDPECLKAACEISIIDFFTAIIFN